METDAGLVCQARRWLRPGSFERAGGERLEQSRQVRPATGRLGFKCAHKDRLAGERQYAIHRTAGFDCRRRKFHERGDPACTADAGSRIPLGFSNGARLCKSQQVRQHGEGWMLLPQQCMRKCCGSQTC